jgi:hypothetical protein
MGSDDLILDGGTEGEGLPEEEFEYEYTTRTEAIHCATNAISAASEMTIMTKLDERRMQRIKRKSLRIIDKCIGEIYDELFYEEENNNNGDD